MNISRLRLLLLATSATAAGALGGCASFPVLQMPAATKGVHASSGLNSDEPVPQEQQRTEPKPPVISLLPRGVAPPPASMEKPATAGDIAAIVSDSPVQAVMPPQPLPQFLDTAFGDILKVPYVLGPNVGSRADIVSLRSGGAMSGRDFFRLVQSTLRDYHLTVYIRGGSVAVLDDASAPGGSTVVVHGRSLADIPTTASTVILFFPLHTLDAGAALPLIKDTFPATQNVKIAVDVPSNSLILTGPRQQVIDATYLIDQLDQPIFAGAKVIRFEPVYWSADTFARALSDSLTSEGFKVSSTPTLPRTILIVPFPSTNQVLVFAADSTVEDRVEFWGREIDKPAALGDQKTTFVYEVQNTEASALGSLVLGSGVLDNAVRPPVGVPGAAPTTSIGNNTTTQSSASPFGAQAGGTSQRLSGSLPSGGDLTVDQIGNRLLFTGTAQQYERLRATLLKLDVPPKQVLIEVTIAEVTLTDATNFGLEFLYQKGSISTGTLGGLGLGASGFNVGYTGTPNLQVAFNAYATNNKVNILSRPRLFARSGTEASVQVGSDVPIITSQQNSSTTVAGTSSLLQSIEYRQTGIILKIKPVVYGDRVDMEVSQEVSNEQNNSNASISSPIILNRSLSTKLSVHDGATAVLGGLIDDNYTKGNTGVPILKDLPVIGQAFRTDTVSGAKTDLLILVTPYIVKDDDQMSGVVNSLASDMNRAFRVGRGFSYTLLPAATGINLGLTLPDPRASSERKIGPLRAPPISPPTTNNEESNTGSQPSLPPPPTMEPGPITAAPLIKAPRAPSEG